MKITRRALLLAMASTLAVAKPPARKPSEVRAVLSAIGAALASSNPADATTYFSKDFPDSDKIALYFDALTTAYEVANEVEVVDETVASNRAQVQATWSLTLTDRKSQESKRRSRDVKVGLVRQPQSAKLSEGDWKIVSFDSIELFNPQ